MSKQVIPEELDLLIQEYLTDGIITEKERKVLLRKAQSLGLDVDEIDLYIDAQQQKADQVIDAAVKKKRGQGCPFCGGSVPQLADKCPHCGQAITAEASEELKEIIENLEDALVDLKSGQDIARSKATVEKHMRKAQLYYSNNPKIKILIEEVNRELPQIDKNLRSQARKQWRKEHPFLLAFLTLLGVCIVLGFILGANGLTGGDIFMIELILLGLGVVAIAVMHDNSKESKKEKEKNNMA